MTHPTLAEWERRWGAAGAQPVPRDRIVVRGADAVSYLHGQLSQDVDALAVGEATWSFLLHPTGKVCAWLRVERTADDEVVLDVDAGHGQVVVDRLQRFLLRTKATVELDAAAGDEPPAGYETWRVEHGFPAMGRELTDDVIPAELGPWIIDASVSFTKGCYTGQELVARVDSRGGNVPRHLRRVELDATAPTAAEGSVLERDGRAVGALTTVAAAPDARPQALAFVHRSVEPPAEVEVVIGDARMPAHVPGDEPASAD